MKTYIHVNQRVIKRNEKNGTNNPVFTVMQERKSIKGNRMVLHSIEGNRVVIHGTSELIYSEIRNVSIVTEAPIEVF